MTYTTKLLLRATSCAVALALTALGAVAQVNLSAETSSPGSSPHLAMLHMADVLGRDGIASIQVQEGQTATDSMVNVAEGKSDIITSPLSLYFLLENGVGPFSAVGDKGKELVTHIRAIMPFNAGAEGLITHVSTGIQSYTDLKGKTVWNGPPRGAALNTGRATITFGSGGYEDGKDYKGLQTDWGNLPSILVDGSADAIAVPLTFPSDRVTTALAAGEVNIISVPKEIFESEAMQRYLSAPGNAPYTIAEKDMGYGAESGVHLISEDGIFRSPAVPFAMMVRADLPDDLVKAITAKFIATMDELKARAPYAPNVGYGVLDQVASGFCGGLTLKYHTGAVAAWEEAGYSVPDCAK